MIQIDIDNIKKQFKEVIAFSQDIENPKVDELFEEWLEAKRDFIEAMGGNLIFEYPETVYFDLNKDEKMKRISDFEDMVAGRYQNEDLANFIEDQKDGFFINKVVSSYKTSNGVMIPKDMKLLKAFKFFEEDKNTLDTLQTAASMIIQEDKIEGVLCLSVHPLDFLSVSENNHNWRSCHALDGEYRAGNLSYMKDKSTIICYLKSKKEEQLENFPTSVKWNSKKWRVLLYFSDHWDMLFAGRQYPFTSSTGLEFIRDKVLPNANLGTWTKWTNKKLQEFDCGVHSFYYNSPLVPYFQKMIPMKELVENKKGSLQFNDLLQSSCYDAYYCYKTQSEDRSWMFKLSFLYEEKEEVNNSSKTVYIMNPSPKLPHFTIGGSVKCLRCGEDIIELNESMMCNDCEGECGEIDSDIFGTCPLCGRRFVFDEGSYVDSADEVICPSCVEDSTIVCANCGGLFYKDDVIYDRKTGEFYCKECFDVCDCELEEDIDE